MGHLDFPRAIEYGMKAGMWSITTNPLRFEKDRWQAFLTNLTKLEKQINRSQGKVKIVTNWTEYQNARDDYKLLCLPAVQGGNSLAGAPNGCASIPNNSITRVTLLHLTNSVFGVTSSPLKLWRANEGLSPRGKDFIRDLNQNRIFVDLAHINKPGFWDAIDVHDPTLPIIVTHTGVEGVCPHWRNLDDNQLRAIADSGGTIGIIFEPRFLTRPSGPQNGGMVIEHMEHIIKTIGEDYVSIGSDYDGMISPPSGLDIDPNYSHLVGEMLLRKWNSERISKILGRNFLRAFKELRPN